MEVYKMPVNIIKHIYYIAKHQKAVKSLKFSDKQNELDYTISIGVEYDSSSTLIGNPDNII